MTETLAHALDALVAAANTAGLDAIAARAEGEAVAATVAERSSGAFVDWCRETGNDTAEDFFAAAKRGNRYRVGPTPLASSGAATYVDALADVAATAAATLGTASPEAAGVALGLGAVQRAGVSPTSAPAATVASAPTSTSWELPPERQAVPDVGDEIVANLRERSQGVLRMLSALNAPTGQQPILPPGTADPSVAAGTAPDQAGTPPTQPSQPGQPTAAAPAEPGAGTAEAKPPEPPPKTVEELLAELDELVGLSEVKAEIRRQAAVLRIEGLRKEAGLESPTITRHLVFNGNPGTGKTTVARLVAGIYRALGLLSTGQLVEVDRSELVAGFLGQTAIKTSDVVKTAIGGVLFIDEAYSLVGGPGDQYGLEAIDTLVKEMEDHRGDLVVIVAGYPLPMAAFIAQNPGLASRFRTHIDFPDYSDGELVEIFEVMTAAAEYDVDPAVPARLEALVGAQTRDSTFGNARYVRNVLEAAVGRHAWRLRDIEKPTLEELRLLLPDDFDPPPGDGPTEAVDWDPTQEPVAADTAETTTAETAPGDDVGVTIDNDDDPAGTSTIGDEESP